MASRFVIGIDLGTSNCALSYIDTQASKPQSQILPLSQRQSETTVKESPILPSFLFLPDETQREKLGDCVVGSFAKDQLPLLPGRVVHSAKSWLCHLGVDREEKLLPWATEELTAEARLSPVEASAKYLAYLRSQWDETMGAADPDLRFDEQEVTITVPASFDEAAQSLTLKAEKLAGFGGTVRLLEEPQAAFYFWLENNSAVRALPQLLERPYTVLICDIGGGTTDFSLFEVAPPRTARSRPPIKRTAVSDHLLLGGDNIDLAIAHRLESGMARGARALSARQWLALTSEARDLKERMLENRPDADPDEIFHVSLAAEGSSLFKTTLTSQICRREVKELILEGFFPEVAASELPQKASTGLKEWGLPFAPDSAITRHLAAFLNGKSVDAILFNGGTLKPTFLQDRLTTQVTKWQKGKAPLVLLNNEMDLAVARGAAFYGAALRKPSTRISGGYAHSVFLEIESAKNQTPVAVCVLPKGTEAGENLKIKKLNFTLLLDRPVKFQLYYSNQREGDRLGDLVPLSQGALNPLPPLQTSLKLPPGLARPADDRLSIELETMIEETGLLRMSCVHGTERWGLDFNLRRQAPDSGEQGLAAEAIGVGQDRLREAIQKIELFYGKKRGDLSENPKGLHRELERILHLEKDRWNLALLRALWPALSDGMGHRGRSQAHESQWLYLAGFCLRPGYGSELDAWRVNELWKIFNSGIIFGNHPPCRTQWWILWRRVAGGLQSSQQEIVAKQCLNHLRRTDVLPEIMLLAGSLERVSLATKIGLAEILKVQLLKHKSMASEACLWALGRIANRFPLYAGAQAALPPEPLARWVREIAAVDFKTRSAKNVVLFLTQACRMTGDRTLDVDDETRRLALFRLRKAGATAEQLAPLETFVPAARDLQASLFGESLPLGLQLA